MSAAASILYLGMDVHKDSITIAVLPTGANDLEQPKPSLRRWWTDEMHQWHARPLRHAGKLQRPRDRRVIDSPPHVSCC